jgi:hypothetical protein
MGESSPRYLKREPRLKWPRFFFRLLTSFQPNSPVFVERGSHSPRWPHIKLVPGFSPAGARSPTRVDLQAHAPAASSGPSTAAIFGWGFRQARRNRPPQFQYPVVGSGDHAHLLPHRLARFNTNTNGRNSVQTSPRLWCMNQIPMSFSGLLPHIRTSPTTEIARVWLRGGVVPHS